MLLAQLYTVIYSIVGLCLLLGVVAIAIPRFRKKYDPPPR